MRVELRVGLRDHLVFLVERGQIDDSVGDAIVFDFAVRRLDKAVFVDARVGRERRDKSDIGALGRFNRADAAVMGRVNVADLESGALAGKTARTKRGQPALVRDFAERIGLIHELRQLRRAEELLDHGRSRLVVDQLLRHQGLDILQAHPLFDRALHPDQPDAELVLDQLSDRAHAAIAKMVDIVNLAVAVLELHQVADDFEDVFAAQRALLERHVNLELVIELQAPDFRQVVALGVEEQVVEEGGRRFLGRRIAGTQAPVDLDYGFFGRAELVLRERQAQRTAAGRVFGEQHFDFFYAVRLELLEGFLGQLLVGANQHLAGGRIDDIVRRDAADNLVECDRNFA